jgi:hypothetical protein
MTSEPAGMTERVAIAALTYHELWRNWSCVGPRENGSEIVYDLDNGREDISLLTMVGSSEATELDWVIVRALDRPDVLASLLKEVEPWRAEAILHALAAGGGWGARFAIPPEIAATAALRWEEVEEAMEQWREFGIAATRKDVFEVYVGAMEAATGRSLAAIVYDFVDETATMAEEREGVA